MKWLCGALVRSTADQICPDGPVDRVGIFLGIQVEDPSGEVVEHGVFQGHAVHLASAEGFEMAADFRHGYRPLPIGA